MPFILKITKKDSKEIVHEFIAMRREIALLKNEEIERLIYPFEEEIITKLKKEKKFKEKQTQKLMYDKKNDKFVFVDINKEPIKNIVNITEAKKYEINPVGIS